MNTQLRFAGLALLAASMVVPAVAQTSGADVYKAKCQMCHGAAGMAESGVGKAMKVKPVSDPEVKKMSEAQMVDAVRKGMGKMQPYQDKLSDAQIKASVAHFRTFVK
ncbi:MAG TPA: cytochrome c [Terracidiphilus sp.]|nr:cytochrome c [Terracidiphilus sp.]